MVAQCCGNCSGGHGPSSIKWEDEPVLKTKSMSLMKNNVGQYDLSFPVEGSKNSEYYRWGVHVYAKKCLGQRLRPFYEWIFLWFRWPLRSLVSVNRYDYLHRFERLQRLMMESLVGSLRRDCSWIAGMGQRSIRAILIFAVARIVRTCFHKSAVITEIAGVVHSDPYDRNDYMEI